MAICVECVYHEVYVTGEEKDVACKNPDLPITDFIYGIRWCDNLNPKGDCRGFKTQAKPESIYESKEDEDLINSSFNPVQTLWVCNVCNKTMVQNLTDDPPTHCYHCKQTQFDEEKANTS